MTSGGSPTRGRQFKLLIVTNIPTPYNTALFRELSARRDVDLTVGYCAAIETNRCWTPDTKGHEAVLLQGRSIPGLGHVNPSVRRLIRSTDPDVTVLSGSYAMPTFRLAVRELRRLRVPWLYWGEEIHFDQRGWLHGRLRSWARAPLRHADRILAIGTRAVESYRRLGIPHSRIGDFHYYADTSAFHLPPLERTRRRLVVREELRIPPSSLLFGFCGQLIRRKRPALLLRAFAKATRSKNRPHLLLVGGGPMASQLEKLSRDLGVQDAVRFLGPVEPRALPGLFASMDALVLPSVHDGWGVVVPEALASGLPVIASTGVNAAIDLIRNGVNGFTFPVDDEEALANLLEVDGNVLGEMGQMGAGSIASESPAAAAEKLLGELAYVVRGAHPTF